MNYVGAHGASTRRRPYDGTASHVGAGMIASSVHASCFFQKCVLEIELERKELIALLDRAMRALPPETRSALGKLLSICVNATLP